MVFVLSRSPTPLLIVASILLVVGCGEPPADRNDVPVDVAADMRAGRTPYEAWRDYAIESEARRLGITVSDEKIEGGDFRIISSNPDDEDARSVSDAEARARLYTMLLLEEIARHPEHYGEDLSEDLHTRVVQMMALTQALLARTWPDLPRPISAAARRGTLQVQENELLFVVTGQGAVVIDFVDFGDTDEAVEYRWRYQPVADVPEGVGSGWVREKYDRIESDGGGYALEDLGSQLFVYAGPVVVEWSRNTDHSGWIYYDPEVITVQILPDSEFDDLDLHRPLPKRNR